LGIIFSLQSLLPWTCKTINVLAQQGSLGFLSWKRRLAWVDCWLLRVKECYTFLSEENMLAKNLEHKLLRYRKEEEVGVGSVMRRGRVGQIWISSSGRTRRAFFFFFSSVRDEPYPQNVELGSSLSCRRFFSFLGKGKGPSCSVGLAFFTPMHGICRCDMFCKVTVMAKYLCGN
jgi:hypothetical protein